MEEGAEGRKRGREIKLKREEKGLDRELNGRGKGGEKEKQKTWTESFC